MTLRMSYQDAVLLLRLGRLPVEHPLSRLFARSSSDLFVAAALKRWELGFTYEEVMTELAIALSEDRERVMNIVVDWAATKTIPTLIMAESDERQGKVRR